MRNRDQLRLVLTSTIKDALASSVNQLYPAQLLRQCFHRRNTVLDGTAIFTKATTTYYERNWLPIVVLVG